MIDASLSCRFHHLDFFSRYFIKKNQDNDICTDINVGFKLVIFLSFLHKFYYLVIRFPFKSADNNNGSE